ncbi:MAG: O-antigen ligase family protein [Betaproteobacteria bacterium]|nr:O-antigen ligase family protein [Betaproteobacteria bacterium]
MTGRIHPAGTAHALALALAGLLFAVIPFRITVDKRGGVLALLVLVLLAVALRRGDLRQCVPRSRALVFAALGWLAVTLVSALAGPDPLEALRSVRSDVLGPMLAFCAFYYLTRDGSILLTWSAVCAAAQLLLAVLMVADPYQPDFNHRPAYVDTGMASCWLVVTAAVLPVLWAAPAPHARWTRPLAIVAVLAMFASALASYNRILWVCYAAMVATGSLAWVRLTGRMAQRPPGLQVLAVPALIVAVLAGVAWYAIEARAPSYQATAEQSPGYVRQDPRAWIWPAGWRMAIEKPITGYGFGTEAWKDEFARQNGSDRAPMRINHAHNALLNYTLQAGVVGGLAVLLLFGALAHAFLASRPPTRDAALLACCGAALVAGFFLRNVTDDYFLRQPLMLFAALAGAFLGPLDRASGMDGASGEHA